MKSQISNAQIFFFKTAMYCIFNKRFFKKKMQAVIAFVIRGLDHR